MKTLNMKYKTLGNWLVLLSLVMLSACSKKSTGSNTGAPVGPVVEQPVTTQMALWLTKGNRSVLFSKQNVALNFGTAANAEATITVDTTQRYQTMDGFGFT